MKILSLFDGMACGALAMQAAGIEIEKYIAYEVDKYAIQTAQHNFPFIEERGDVFKADFTEYAGFDYLIGGSPCTYWSIAQTKNRETVASGMGWELFSQYVRALHEAKPRFFLYENNKSMSAAIRASITETFGFEPILINSALVSAQNRQRLYWCGIRQADGTYRKADIQQPADRGILLKDILETGVTWRDKSHTIDATYYKGGTLNGDKLHQNATRLMVAEPINAMKYELKSVENKDAGIIGILDMAGQEQIKRVYGTNGKCATLTTCQGGHREPKVFEKIAEPVCLNRDTDKSVPLTASYFKYAPSDSFKKANPRMGIAEPVCVAQRGRYDESGKVYQHYEAQSTGKTNNLTTVSKDNLIAEPVCLRYERTEQAKKLRKQYENHEIKHGYHELSELHPRPDGKTNTLSTVQKDNMIMEPLTTESIDAPIYEVKDGFITVKGNKYPIKLVDGFYIIRKLTVRECMRLQTVPEWYEWPVSKSQAYKMLGNGWTVEVIAHLLRGLK